MAWDTAAPANMTANIEAEHGVLGAVLYDNDYASEIEGLEPHHFSEGTHAAIWSSILHLLAAQRIADMVTVGERIQEQPGFRELGGLKFLSDLVDNAPSKRVALDYARVVIERAAARQFATIAKEAAAEATAGANVAATIAKLESALLTVRTGERRASLVSANIAAQEVLHYLEQPEGSEVGVGTGLAPLDEHLGVMLPDDLILMAGRPGMGKSALAASVALNIARSGIGVIEINSEMTTAQMMRRHLTDLCFTRYEWKAPTYKDIRRRRVTPGQRGMLEWAAGEIADVPLALVKRTGLTIASLRALVRRQAAVWSAQGIRLGAITVDHVGLLQADGGGRDRYTDQTAIAISMKALADELHVPVIALVQLSRKVEDRDQKRPQLADLRDTGAWEENADVVIGVYRDAYYASREQEPKSDGRPNAELKWSDWDKRRKTKTIEAILMKVREGEEGVVELWASIGHNAIRGSEPALEGFL